FGGQLTQPYGSGRGGYRRPRNPAPASGPGRLSRRTDRGQRVRELSDAAYGEQSTFRADQQGAPMANNPAMAAGAGGTGPAVDLSKIVSLSAPSMRPDEPVTAGSLPQSTLGGAVAGVDETTLNYLRQVLPTLA